MQIDNIFRNLESDLDQWRKVIGSSINPVPSDALEVSAGPNGELIFTNAVGATDMGGGLISRHLPFPSGLPALPYVEFSLDYLVPVWSRAGLLRLETDIKGAAATTAAGSNTGNVADGSAQLNMSLAGGTWEIDQVTLDATVTPNTTRAKWTPTIYTPGLAPAETWTHLSIRQYWDFANGRCSVLSIAQGADSPYVIPDAQQKQPLLIVPTGWGAGITVQLQTEGKAGAVQVVYRNVNLWMSSYAR